MATNRKPIAIPVVGTDIDVGRVAAVMNLLAANLNAPTPVSMIFWASDYPDAHVAFAAFAAMHPRDVTIEERLKVVYVFDAACRGIATFYRAEAEERIEAERLARSTEVAK